MAIQVSNPSSKPSVGVNITDEELRAQWRKIWPKRPEAAVGNPTFGFTQVPSTRPAAGGDIKTIRIENLPDTVTTWRLRRAICLFGDITELIHEPQEGYALVTMATREQAESTFAALRDHPGPD
ncbi:hypothetical protein HK102_013494 [Quaeritorhiza haematococci]|nr:hypothetical protein HK102_013494 [Quaeritorhiza haematococci]